MPEPAEGVGGRHGLKSLPDGVQQGVDSGARTSPYERFELGEHHLQWCRTRWGRERRIWPRGCCSALAPGSTIHIVSCCSRMAGCRTNRCSPLCSDDPSSPSGTGCVAASPSSSTAFPARQGTCGSSSPTGASGSRISASNAPLAPSGVSIRNSRPWDTCRPTPLLWNDTTARPGG